MKTIDPVQLQEAVGRIVRALDPAKVFLYGSHAYGDPSEDSDIDLLVVLPDSMEPLHSKAVEAYRSIRGLRLPLEIKVVYESDFIDRSQWTSSIERIAREEGEMIFDGEAA
jgi:uncharacterized protein